MRSAETPVPVSAYELLTEQFYAWERRGRGWQVWRFPVDIEPPYRPFFGHYLPRAVAATDDARIATFWSSVAERLRETFRAVPRARVNGDAVLWSELSKEEPEAERFEDDDRIVEIQVALPQQIAVTKAAVERVLLNVGDIARPLAFEITGTESSIAVQFACAGRDSLRVRHILSAYFPDAGFSERSGVLEEMWRGRNDASVVVDFGLSEEFMRPLRSFDRFDPDPLAGMVAALEDVREGETALFQVLFMPARYGWAASIARAVTDGAGGPFFADDSRMTRFAEQKIGQPLFAVVLRAAARSPNETRAWAMVRGIGNSLRQFSEPGSNELIPLTNDGYDNQLHCRDVMLRESRRSGMLLNSDELLSIVHLPSASVRSAKLKRETRRTKSLPASAVGHRLILGENRHNGKSVSVSLHPDLRMRHIHVIGASGTGKSTLLTRLIVQDIENGEGVAVLDPHGDLIDDILGRIPDARLGDVVLIDPSDADYPVGFNILRAHSEIEKTLLSSDLVAAFRRLSTSWGDQMTSVLGNAISAFLESDEGGTIADLRKFLVEADFRTKFLNTVRDPEVVYYWKKEFPLLHGRPQAPILTRLDTFLRPKLIRNMVAQHVSRLDVGAVMNEGKILLVKLAQGAIGEENAHLLGTFLVSKLHQMAIARQEIAESDRRPFYCYIDEFHNFVTPSMAAILSGARKYRLGLVLAHQDLRQLSRDDDVASAVVTNPSTRICFRVGDADAKRLAEGFSFFTAQDIQSLAIGEAICRVERADQDFNLHVPPPLGPVPDAAEHRLNVIARSREQYANHIDDLEKRTAAATPLSSAQTFEFGEAKPGAPAVRTLSNASLSPAAPEITSSTPRKTVRANAALSLAGRGGAQHRYLQQLLAKWAEAHGWRVSIEKPVLDGLGNVDVALEREGQSVACEISITTSIEHEIGNIQKCLAAGFAHVLFISADKKILARAKDIVQGTLSDVECALVTCCAPEDAFVYLEDLDAEKRNKESMVRGYKVRVKHLALDKETLAARKQTIAQMVVQGLKKLGRG